MKITKVTKFTSKCVPNDVKRTSTMLSRAVKNGWISGKKKAEIDNKGLISDMYGRSKDIAGELKKLDLSWEDAPAIAAVISSLTPIPIIGLGLYVYALGTGVKISVKQILRAKKYLKKL